MPRDPERALPSGGEESADEQLRYQLDAEGRFVAVSDGFTALTGRDQDSLVGEHVSTVIEERDRGRYEVAVGKLREESELAATQVAVRLDGSDGESVPCTIQVTRLDGDETGWRSLGEVTVHDDASETSRDPFRQILENAQVTAFVIDDEQRFTYMNERIEEYFDTGKAAFLSRSLEAVSDDIVRNDDDRERLHRLVDDLLAGERRDGQIELPLGTPSEGQIVVDIRFTTVERDGEVERLVGVSRDVTDKVRQREALRRERDLTRHLFRTAPVGIVVHGSDGAITRTNERAETILGLSEPQLTDECCETLACTFREEDGEEIPLDQLPTHRVMETGRAVFGEEFQVVRPDGDERWLSVNAAPVVGPDGEIERIVGVFVDITEHREYQQELEAERAFTEAIHNSVPDLVYAFDDEGQFIRWNEHGVEVSGYDDEELRGMHPLDFIPDADHEMLWDAIEAVYKGSVERRETRLVTKDGTEIPYEFSAAPIVDDGGDVIGFAGVGRDISERQARERTLREQNERLERLNRINAVIRDVDEALVSASSREEIETAVCERLTAADAYQLAWIGREQQTDRIIVPKAMAGQPTEYLQAVTIRSDDSPLGRGPAGRTHRTREIQVSQNIREDPTFEPYLDVVETAGFESVASIPIIYEETLYGVLSVYAAEPFSFGAMEQAVLSELGETIGHAISGLQAKRALATERATEVTVEIADPDRFILELSTRADCTLTYEGSVYRSDEELLYYITVDGADAAEIRAVADDFEYIDHLRIVSEYDDVCVIELKPPSPATLEIVTDHGGTIETATASGGVATFTFELPDRADSHELLTVLRERFDDVTLVSQRETEQSVQTRHQFRETVTEQLTGRQQAALEIAYYADYFDWPRGSTGEELASALDVSAPTFHKHLRLAEQKLVGTVLDGDQSATGD
ncbi:MAG: PAS domain S-box protein [Halorientalis sp.]